MPRRTPASLRRTGRSLVVSFELALAWGRYRASDPCRSSPEPSTVNRENHTVNVVGRARGEEQHRAGDVRRVAPATGRDALQDLGGAARVVLERLRIVRCDVPRRNRVDVDARGRPLVRE